MRRILTALLLLLIILNSTQPAIKPHAMRDKKIVIEKKIKIEQNKKREREISAFSRRNSKETRKEKIIKLKKREVGSSYVEIVEPENGSIVQLISQPYPGDPNGVIECFMVEVHAEVGSPVSLVNITLTVKWGLLWEDKYSEVQHYTGSNITMQFYVIIRQFDDQEFNTEVTADLYVKETPNSEFIWVDSDSITLLYDTKPPRVHYFKVSGVDIWGDGPYWEDIIANNFTVEWNVSDPISVSYTHLTLPTTERV